MFYGGNVGFTASYFIFEDELIAICIISLNFCSYYVLTYFSLNYETILLRDVFCGPNGR